MNRGSHAGPFQGSLAVSAMWLLNRDIIGRF